MQLIGDRSTKIPLGGKNTDHPTINPLDPLKLEILDALKRSNFEKGLAQVAAPILPERAYALQKPSQTLRSKCGIALILW